MDEVVRLGPQSAVDTFGAPPPEMTLEPAPAVTAPTTIEAIKTTAPSADRRAAQIGRAIRPELMSCPGRQPHEEDQRTTSASATQAR